MSINAAHLLVDHAAATRPDHPAIVAGSSCVSYAAFAELTNRIGNVLLQCGCVPGDRVLLAMSDSAELAAALLAAIKIGALAVPIGSGGSADDLSFYFADTSARIAIATPEAIEAVLSAAPADATVLVTGVTGATGVPPRLHESPHVHAWQPALDSASTALAVHQPLPDDPAIVLYTSGSTGQQKAAVHSHRAILAAARNVGRDVFEIGPADRILSTARLSFAFGLGFGLTMPLAAGATTILQPSRDLRDLARTIAEQRPTILCGVPSLLSVLLRASTTWLAADFSSLRFIVSAGEPLPATVYDGYRERFGVEVLDGIGSTEMLTHFITNRPGQSRRGSCGVPVPGCEVYLGDDDGVPSGDGEIGNLRVNGATAFIGYWNRPEATARVKSSQGVATGDKLYRDPDGFYHYCGRNDDMLKVAGMWVAPNEIESVLRGHADVEQCAVTTRADAAGHRRLVAYVVARPGATLRPSDLYHHAGQQLQPHMIPAAFVALSALPLTPNGKLKRSALPDPSWTTARGASV
jgi:acyl-coenzyme A synthetase/AMP-(fatty) acid ligase